MTLKLFLFDVDGTIVDSQHVIHEAMVRTFHGAGLKAPTLETTRSIIGLSLPLAIARLRRTDEGATALAETYKRNFQTIRGEPDFCEPLFPQAFETLRTLGERDDLLLGIVTGKSRRGVRAVLATHGLENLFVAIRTADDCPSKPHPAMVLECCAETGIDPADALVLGDATYDVEMARAAGARPIGVSWGYHGAAVLSGAGAERVLMRFADIAHLVPAAREHATA